MPWECFVYILLDLYSEERIKGPANRKYYFVGVCFTDVKGFLQPIAEGR